MINKILWASDDSGDSNEILKYVELFDSKFNVEILGLYVIPDYPEKKIGGELTTEQSDRFIKWVKNTESEEKKRLREIATDLKEKGIDFGVEIVKGIPHREILRVAETEKADLIALGKGKHIEKFILGGTAVRVLRQSSIPILTARESRQKKVDIRRILVPLDISHGLPKSLKYAVELSKRLDAEIYLLNIVEVGEYSFPPEVVERVRELSFRGITENIDRTRIEDNVETFVEVAENPWVGIVKFVREKDIDLIVMMTFGDTRFRGGFIGSTAEKVIQEAPCPVIAMRP